MRRIEEEEEEKEKEEEKKKFYTALLHVDTVRIFCSHVNIYIILDPQNELHVTNLSFFPALGKRFLWS